MSVTAFDDDADAKFTEELVLEQAATEHQTSGRWGYRVYLRRYEDFPQAPFFIICTGFLENWGAKPIKLFEGNLIDLRNYVRFMQSQHVSALVTELEMQESGK